MKITLPATLNECRPEQLTKWLMLADVIKEKTDEDLFRMLDFQCQLISIFSGIPLNKVKKINVADVQELSKHLFKLLSSYEYKEPTGEITIKGQTYVFEKNFEYISTGQIIDLKLIEDISSDPCQALAICYIEKGMEYCQEDERGRVLNPNGKRYEVFKEQFDGVEFMNFFGFFLLESEKRSNAILGIQTLKAMLMTKQIETKLRTTNGSHGPRSYIDWEMNSDDQLMRLLNDHISKPYSGLIT